MDETNEFQAQELGVSAEVVAEMPDVAVNEMPAVEQPKMVPETDVFKIQAVKDREQAELRAMFEAKLQAIEEDNRMVRATLASIEQERVKNMDPDERVEYERNQYQQEAQTAKQQLELMRLQQKAISLGLPMEVAMSARSVADLDRAMWMKEQTEKEALRKKLAEYESQKELEARKPVDVVVPMGSASPRKLSANELIAKGVEELINPRR